MCRLGTGGHTTGPGKLGKVSAERPMIHLSLHGVMTKALVDTGSPCTLVSEEHFRFVCRKAHRHPLTKTTRSLCSVSGHPLKVLGEIKLPIGKGVIDAVVVRGLPHQVIVGGDCLRKGEGIVDYSREIVHLYDTEYSFRILPASTVVCTLESTRKWEQEYPAAFASKKKPLGRVKTQCIIDTGDHAPVRMRAYRAPLAKRQQIEKEIEDMLQDGVIEPSKSPWASPVTLVSKPDGSIRFCSDYRRVNSITKKDCYPIPHVQDILDSLGGSKWFSTLDLKSGY